MRIYQANHQDAALLAGIISEANQDVAHRFGITAANAPTHPSRCTPDWITSALDKGVWYWIIADRGEACGCVALEMARPGLCYLERLAVRPSRQRRGLGRMLVQHAINKALETGASRVEIGIIAQHTELQTWYEKLGFVRTGGKTFDHLPFDVTFLRYEAQPDGTAPDVVHPAV